MAYAFLVDGEWYDFGIPEEENKNAIEEAIRKYNKDVKTYDTVEDIG